MAAPEATQTGPQGGVAFAWELGSSVRAFNAKSGKRWTVVELRNPQDLKQYVSIWLEGDAGATLEAITPRTVVPIRVEGLRAGRERGELVATASRASVEEAFARVGGKA